jgi:predicted enzyme related to lactoylglutathione lyase
MNAGRLNGGMRGQSERERGISPNWLPYFTVEKADHAASRAEDLGAQRLVSITEMHAGRFAVLADPQGAAFAVFEGDTDR